LCRATSSRRGRLTPDGFCIGRSSSSSVVWSLTEHPARKAGIQQTPLDYETFVKPFLLQGWRTSSPSSGPATETHPGSILGLVWKPPSALRRSA
jgi:hypothetical protein